MRIAIAADERTGNVLTLSLRSTSAAELGEILDAWMEAEPSPGSEDRANVEHLAEIEGAA